MNGVSQVPQIERLEFFNGQRLFAEDLQTLDGFNRQMRWLHNRSLHAFGIGSGFAVRGERGDRAVTISPGYAIDNEGREIILLVPRDETVPPIAGDKSGNPRFYYLTVHYPRTEDLEELETRSGICSTSGVVRRREEPVFCWIELGNQFKPTNDKHVNQIADGEKIVLARISVKNCQLETLSITTRRNARPERLPYVACGRTLPESTIWTPWQVPLSSDTAATRIIGVQVTVDTSSGKFASVPCYTARVAGERVLLNQGSPVDDFILEGFTTIDPDASPTKFTLRVFLPSFFSGGLQLNPINIVNNTNIVSSVRAAGWYVEWMGVEG